MNLLQDFSFEFEAFLTRFGHFQKQKRKWFCEKHVKHCGAYQLKLRQYTFFGVQET